MNSYQTLTIIFGTVLLTACQPGMQTMNTSGFAVVASSISVTPTPEPPPILIPTITPRPTESPSPTATPKPTVTPNPTATPVPVPTVPPSTVGLIQFPRTNFNSKCGNWESCAYTGTSTGEAVTMSCTGTQTISVQAAYYGAPIDFYGVGLPRLSCLDYVNSECNGKASCSVIFNATNCGGDTSTSSGNAGTADIVCTGSGQTIPGGVIKGTYKAASVHPYVMTTAERMKALVQQASVPSVNQALILLRNNAAANYTNLARLQTAYAGCDELQYENLFSVGVSKANPQGGAAPAAAQSALYAYLMSISSGNAAWRDTTIAAHALTTAEAILYNWGSAGFRINGVPMLQYSNFCTSVAAQSDYYTMQDTYDTLSLQVGRGMTDYVYALDLVEATKVESASWNATVEDFLKNQQILIQASLGQKYYSGATGCGRFDNQTTQALLSSTAIARYLNDSTKILELVGQTESDYAVTIPQQINGTIYGTNDTPRTCGANDPGMSFQTNIAAPGEIVDRYRNHQPQPFGYPSGNLACLEITARMLGDAGFNMFGYVGNKNQSIQTAIDYYSWYSQTFLGPNVITIPTSGYDYPDIAQYAGDNFNVADYGSIANKDGWLTPYIYGYSGYPNDTKITNVLKKAAFFPGSTVNPFYSQDTLFYDSLAQTAQLYGK